MNQAAGAGQRWFEAVESGDEDRMKEALSEDVDFMTPGAGQVNRDGAVETAMLFVKAFPDAKFTIDRWIEDEDTAVCEGMYSGTHTDVLQSPMGDIPPTGKGISIPFAAVFGEREGKVAFHHAYWDNAAFMTQLGLLPEPGQGA